MPPKSPTNTVSPVTKAAFTGAYNTIWNFISPQLQSDVPHSHWLSCQKQNPVAPRGLHVDRIALANTRTKRRRCFSIRSPDGYRPCARWIASRSDFSTASEPTNSFSGKRL